MKKFLTISAAAIQLFIFSPLYSAVYDASTLHNSVSRSETVQDLYMQRWDILDEKNFYIDLYGKLNWVYGLNVNTYDAGSDTIHKTDLRLVRSYGSVTLAFPIGGHRETPADSDFIFALNTTGFHYGLTKEVEINRGSAGSETATDYKFSQFFDDIYAFTFMYRPYFTFHGGYIFNNEYAPKEDGTMDYDDPVESYHKKFFAVELYKFMAFSMNVADGKPETTKASVELNPIIAFVTDVSSIYTPVMHLGYERTKAYNDEPYDSVWAKTATGKSDTENYGQDSAILNIFSFKIKQRLSELFTVEGFVGAQYVSDDIYTKTTGKKIDVAAAKEWYVLLNFEPVSEPNAMKGKVYTGMSWYWDPAIAIHRDKPEKGNAVYGWILGAEFDLIYIGADFKTEYNFSSELKKLMEASDKWAIEGSLFLRI